MHPACTWEKWLPATPSHAGYFHRSLGLSFIISCTHKMKSPVVGHLDPWGALKHQLDNLWMQHTSLSVLPTRPAQLCLGSKKDTVNNSLGLAQLITFSSPKPGFTTQDAEVHLRTPPTAAPGDAAVKTGLVPNKPPLGVLSLTSFRHFGLLAGAAVHPTVLGAQTLIILLGRLGQTHEEYLPYIRRRISIDPSP